MNPKILFLDLETRSLHADWGTIITVGYKWAHQKKAHSLSLWDLPGFTKDALVDKKLCSFAYDIVMQADLVVTHYGAFKSRRFDLPFLNARLRINRLKGLPKNLTNVDTYDLAKSTLAVSSRKLGALCEMLHLPQQKMKSDKRWWDLALINKDISAGHKIARYCEQDIYALEALYNELKGGGPDLPHYTFAPLMVCPKCGSDDLVHKEAVPRHFGMVPRFLCRNCGNRPLAKRVQKLKEVEYKKLK